NEAHYADRDNAPLLETEGIPLCPQKPPPPRDRAPATRRLRHGQKPVLRRTKNIESYYITPWRASITIQQYI
ncbi:hypothetical protein, partial [Burkholderia vietnamiensis]|uniref:hypothetical protein n=1 Tax=Burkholderia vietnamiensis TaxID=60552 RepID=UPI001ABA1A9A